MVHVKGCLMMQAKAFCRKNNGIAVKGIRHYLFPDRNREAGGHDSICSSNKSMSTVFVEKTLFFTLKTITDDSLGCTV